MRLARSGNVAPIAGAGPAPPAGAEDRPFLPIDGCGVDNRIELTTGVDVAPATDRLYGISCIEVACHGGEGKIDSAEWRERRCGCDERPRRKE